MMFLDRLNGSLRRITHNKVNIKRYMVLFQRLNMYLIGGALAVPFIVYNVFDDEYIKKRNSAIFFKEDIRQQFAGLKTRFESMGEDPGTFEQFYKEQKHLYYDDLAFIGITTLGTLLPWLFIIFARPGAPVQVNRKRQLIYTWHRGKLYAARLDQLQPKCPATAGGWELSGGWGPLVLHLYPAGKVYDEQGKLNKGKKFKVGLYIPTLDWENKQLLRFIEEFLNGETSLPENYQTRKGWLEYAPRSPKELPSDEILDKAIDEWAKHSFWGSSHDYWGIERESLNVLIEKSQALSKPTSSLHDEVKANFHLELDNFSKLFDKFSVLKPQSSQPTTFQLNLPNLDPTKGTAVLEVDIEIEYWLESSYIFDDNITLSRFKYELNYQDEKANIDFSDFLPQGPGYIKEIIINAEYQQQGQPSMEIDDHILYEYEAPTSIPRDKFDIQRGVPSTIVHMPQWRI
ncbi:hypothetical protein [Kangiella shandongensis]|uniref:hypothetical protein n=1 Tax=Kangiella shandongensis TaxID=2763258 RepID=UPI001CBEF577|nr:hypothetical protein [Kangiella shandongensis]